jgi:DNA polymerase-1
MKDKTFVIIDGNALMHRAWHALPPLSTKDGMVVNAIYGWLMAFFKMLEDIRPEYLAITFDAPGKNFRHELFGDYKAHRKKQPDEFYAQFDVLKDILSTMGLTVIVEPGIEADDVIGTIAHKYIPDNIQTVILTGDKDTFQLINTSTRVLTFNKGVSSTVMYGRAEFKDKYEGLQPGQLIDYKAIAGDSSDNIPGVKGIGHKGAIKLLLEYKTLEKIYDAVDNAPENFTNRTLKLLTESRDNAFLSQELATIKCDAQIDFNVDSTELSLSELANKQEVHELLQRYEFNRLMTRLEQLGGDSEDIKGSTRNTDYSFAIVENIDKLDQIISEAKKAAFMCFDTETTGLNPRTDKLFGISLCFNENGGYYIPYLEEFQEKLQELFLCDARKIAHNAKFDLHFLHNNGIEVNNLYFDTMVAAYVLDPDSRDYSLDGLSLLHFNFTKIKFSELLGKGKDAITIDQVPVEQLAQYAVEDVVYTFKLFQLFKESLVVAELDKVFYELEMPLVSVLRAMEHTGVNVDINYLKELEVDFQAHLDTIREAIFKHAGCEFNVDSPKQLQEVLFEQMELPTKGIKKNKNGYSTAADQLVKLEETHPIIAEISKYREYAKLQSTYVKALPKLVEADGRIHTSYNQTIAATGRLSSSNPNLQNIPTRTELGKKIRKAFVAQDDSYLVSIDYSQVELRIAAYLSNDSAMLDAFNSGQDFHAATAAQMFDVSIDSITKGQRSQAKAINFGILYGIGPNKLGKNLGLTVREASQIIHKYYTVYADLHKFLEDTKFFAHNNGYVQTLFGRKRFIQGIKSQIPYIKAAAERVAINAPMQGTSADVIKRAMIDIHSYLQDIPGVDLIMQVHDELIFNVSRETSKDVISEIMNIMKHSGGSSIPLKVDAEFGPSYGELE